tara:strand:+ start:869 stop:1312 length:444 start_codon:yes stop_codon:yes gene_type:complete
MKRLLILVCLLAVTPGAVCFDAVSKAELNVRDARLTSNIAAMTLAATQTTAELLYEFEQRMVIEKALKEEGMTKTEIRNRIEVLRARWVHLRGLFKQARAIYAEMSRAFADGANVLEVATIATQYTRKELQIAAELDAARERLGVKQ